MSKNKKKLDELIIIKTNEMGKVKKFLDKEHINYKISRSKTSFKTKSLSSKKRRDIKEVMKAFDKARIKA